MKQSLILLSLLLNGLFSWAQVNVTFTVDMSLQTVNPAGVHVAGNFQGWNPAGTPLTNMGANLWSVTVSVAANSTLEYKFINGNAWGNDEGIPNECNVFGNRSYTVGLSDVSIPTVCFASCSTCFPPVHNVTFQVDMSNTAVNPAGVHIAGDFQGWNPSASPMVDQGNGLWTISFPLNQGQTYQYKFINGDAWGQEESVPFGCESFGNRYFTVGNSDEAVPVVCYGTCAPCIFVNYNITFRVDMSNENVDPSGAHLAGSFNNWIPQAMTNTGGDIWELVLGIQSGQTIEYKFVNGANFNLQAESVDPLCANGNGNRSYFVSTFEEVLPLVCFDLCGSCPQNLVDVTFEVDMTGIATNPIGVFIVGSFQSPTPWTAGADQMTNMGGNIWSYTATLEPDAVIEYKYLNGPNWANEETVPGGCGVNNGFGGFNRTWTVGNADETIPVHCFSECGACGIPPVNITLQVDMSQQTVDAAGVHVAGSFQGWNPAGTLMTNLGNGIWAYTLALQPSDLIEYKFVNGNTWGQEEAVPFNCAQNTNRYFVAGNNSETLDAVCFGTCAICSPPLVDVTFQVDMSQQTVNPAGVHIAGDFQDWIPGATPMIDMGNGIWAITLPLEINTAYSYKFINGNAWGNDEFVPAGCEVFGNRQVTTFESDLTLDVVCYASCVACPPLVDVTFSVDMSQQAVNPAGVHLAGTFQGWNPSSTLMTDMGEGIWEITLSLPEGSAHAYKFINGNAWGNDESVFGPCANGNGERTMVVPAGGLVLYTPCYGSCETCKINVSFRVDMWNENVSPAGVHLAGSFQNWDPGATPMNYLGFGIWEAVLELERFTYYEWKFVNGNSWGDDEDVPVDCQINWNRNMVSGSSDMNLDVVCFRSCTLCDGCTDPFSTEFNPFAGNDNGTCATPVVWGCTYADADNYNQAANEDDGSCTFTLGSSCPSDITGDGIVNSADLLALLALFGTVCP
jgi:1,4-alpha-glucan branching enzyme